MVLLNARFSSQAPAHTLSKLFNTSSRSPSLSANPRSQALAWECLALFGALAIKKYAFPSWSLGTRGEGWAWSLGTRGRGVCIPKLELGNECNYGNSRIKSIL